MLKRLNLFLLILFVSVIVVGCSAQRKSCEIPRPQRPTLNAYQPKSDLVCTMDKTWVDIGKYIADAELFMDLCR